MFAARQTADLVSIVRAGASLDMAAGSRQTEDLVAIVRAAKTAGVKVVFRGMSGRQTVDLVAIGRAGGDTVTIAD